GDAYDVTGIFGREETFGHDHIKDDRDKESGDRDQEHDRLEFEHTVERPLIGTQHTFEKSLEHAQQEELLLAFGAMTAKHARAQHRGQRQRDETGNNDRDRDRHRELAKDAADHATHQQHRDEHRDQREGDRYDGEADFARALQRSLERSHATFDVAHDIFQ